MTSSLRFLFGVRAFLPFHEHHKRCSCMIAACSSQVLLVLLLVRFFSGFSLYSLPFCLQRSRIGKDRRGSGWPLHPFYQAKLWLCPSRFPLQPFWLRSWPQTTTQSGRLKCAVPAPSLSFADLFGFALVRALAFDVLPGYESPELA